MSKKVEGVVVITGLGTSIGGLLVKIIAPIYRLIYGFDIMVYFVDWKRGNLGHEIEVLHKEVLRLRRKHEIVHVIGISAGASIAIIISAVAANLISKTVLVCGRLFVYGHPPLEKYRANRVFMDSVPECESRVGEIDFSKVLYVQPKADESVPLVSMGVAGAKKLEIWSTKHIINIALPMTLFFPKIAEFLKEDS